MDGVVYVSKVLNFRVLTVTNQYVVNRFQVAGKFKNKEEKKIKF
jgi:hypothetical protein